MSFWGWAGAIAAGWFTASALFAIAWNTVGKRIFRKPPVPKGVENGDHIVVQIGDKRVIRRVGDQ